MYIHKPWKTFFAPTVIKYEAPTLNDYQYAVPTVWLDKTTDICYLLVDNTMGAAIWVSRENSNVGDNVWILYGQNACYFAGNVGIHSPDPDKTLTVAGTIGAGQHGTEFTVDMNGSVVCENVNNQIISNAASFTGTVNAVGGFKVGNVATNGMVLKADGVSYKGAILSGADVGLGNVDNTSDANKPISSDTQTALDAKADLVAGKVPTEQLPTTVFLELGNDANNAYWGDKGKIAYDHSFVVVGNPHNVTAADIGLGNVNNTSDANKPISGDVAVALNNKANLVLGKVPIEELPSLTYNIVEYANLSAFPSVGSNDTYYRAIDSGFVYLWTGSTYASITGDITLADRQVTLAKIQNINQNVILGRISAGSGVPEQLTAANVRTILGGTGIASDAIWIAAGDIVVGTGTGTAARLAKGSSGQVLTAGASTLSWQTPATGGGTITNVTGASPVVSSGGTTPEISMPAATASNAGYATAAQITKLDGIAAGANNYSHPTGDGNLHVPATAAASAGQALLVATPGAAPTWQSLSTHAAVTVVDSSSIDFTLSGQQVTAVVLPGGVDHNSLLNYSANKHIDHTGVSIIAGTGMSGGGDLSSSRTLNCTVVGYSVATARTDLLVDAITDSDTTHAPTGNAVFDALALKANLNSPVFTGTVTIATVNVSGTITAANIKTGNLNTSYVPYYDSTNGLSNSIIQSVGSVIGIGISPSSAFLHLAAATSLYAPIRLEQSAIEPTSPAVGSLWFYVDGGGIPYLKFKKTSSVTVDLLALSGVSQWTTNGSNIYFGTNLVGSIGVGISGPTAKIHAYGTVAGAFAGLKVENTSVTGASELKVIAGANSLYLGSGSVGWSGFESGSWIWNTGSGKLSFGSGGAECFNINGSNVLTISTPTNKYHSIYKTQSSVDLTVPATNPAFSPAIAGGTANGVGFMLSIVPQLFCGTTCNAVPTISGTMWYATIHSKVLNTGGIGTRNVDGSYATAMTNNIGLVHEVENKGGKSGDCSAVFHQIYMHGHAANESSESTSFFYDHLIGGWPGVSGNDGLGAYYTSVIEGQQYYMNGGSNSRGCKGWWHLLYISDNFASGGTSAGNWHGYDFITALNGVDDATFGADPKTGYGTIYAGAFLRALGKWNTIFSAADSNNASTFQLTLGVCGIDLSTNVTYASANVPALMIKKETYIDLYGNDPGTCKISAYDLVEGGVEGGILMTVRESAGVGTIAMAISDGQTYLRIGGTVYTLSVVGGVVYAT